MYDKLNQYINEAGYNDELINDAFDKLVSVLYISSQGALTVMVRLPGLLEYVPQLTNIGNARKGGFLVTLAALFALQTQARDKYTWLRVAGRAIVGTILLFCTLLKYVTASFARADVGMLTKPHHQQHRDDFVYFTESNGQSSRQ